MTDDLRIVKMSAAGNDFILVEPASFASVSSDREDWIRRVCRRRLSVGADGVMFVEPRGGDRVAVCFHNPDGGVAFCGNGSRCAARLARDRGWAGGQMVLETAVGDVPARVDSGRVTLRLPGPLDRGPVRLALDDGSRVEGRWILAGVPHLLITVDDTSASPLDRWGPQLRLHPQFGADGTNVDVVSTTEDGVLHVRTWERGVEGETLACGSAAVAAAFAASLSRGPGRFAIVPESGIPLEVVIDDTGEGGSATLAGDARWIFEGRLSDEATSGFAD